MSFADDIESIFQINLFLIIVVEIEYQVLKTMKDCDKILGNILIVQVLIPFLYRI